MRQPRWIGWTDADSGLLLTGAPFEPVSVNIRAVEDADQESIVRLLSRTLGWEEDDRHRALLAWKHHFNPFGKSPGWVAEDEEGLAGFRTLMRWEFQHGDKVVNAARAVDTATEPRAQGRGIFRRLTLRSVEDMGAAGVSFVFNTPNSHSMPGYLSMGWRTVGRLPVSFRPARLLVLPRLVRAQTAGDLWSQPTTIGAPADEVLEDVSLISGLLSECRRTPTSRSSLGTNRTPEFIRWRYGRCPVGYRVFFDGRSPADGVFIFRLRRRGSALEMVVADSLVPDPALGRRLRGAALSQSGADYAVALGASRPRSWPPASGRGPVLTWRHLAWEGEPPALRNWSLCTGDVELF